MGLEDGCHDSCRHWGRSRRRCGGRRGTGATRNFCSCFPPRTCIHTYIRNYCNCFPPHTCIHTYIHTCMHTYIHTYVHTYIHTYIRTFCDCSTALLKSFAAWTRTRTSDVDDTGECCDQQQASLSTIQGPHTHLQGAGREGGWWANRKVGGQFQAHTHAHARTHTRKRIHTRTHTRTPM